MGSVEKPKGSGNNPFDPKYTRPDKFKRIEQIIRAMGTQGAAAMAKSAGVTLDGRPLK